MSARLAVVPETAPRALGLIRVSKERDGMISPEVQRASISDYAAKRGYEITGWLEGLDESGSRKRSAWWPRLDQAVAAVEAHEYDVLLVWKFSRVARQRLRWAVALDRVEVAGGRLESATEQFDTTTSSGRLARGMMAELQSFEAERIGETWKEAHSRRVAAGLPSTGKARYGYRYDLEAKLHVPDPVTGPILASLYARYVAGEGFPTLVRWLNQGGHWTTDGGPWADRTLRRVMDAGFGAGIFTHLGVVHQGVHEPLFDDALWAAYRARRAVRRSTSPAVKGSPYLLSGLVRCASCGAAMHGSKPSASSRDTYRYKCRARVEFGLSVCSTPTARMGQVDAAVLAWVQALADEVEDASSTAVAARAARRVAVQVDVEHLARELGRVEETLGRLALQNAQAPLPDAVYESVRAGLDEQYAALTGRLEQARVDALQPEVGAAEIASRLVAGWSDTPVELRREMLQKLVGAVLVTGGNPARVRVVPRWDLRT